MINKQAIDREIAFNNLDLDYDGMPIDFLSFIQFQENQGVLSESSIKHLYELLETGHKNIPADELPPFKNMKDLLPIDCINHSTLEFASPFNQSRWFHTIPDFKYVPQEFQQEFKNMVLLQILRYFKKDLRTKYFDMEEDRSWTNGSELMIKMLENGAIKEIPTINWKKYYSKNPVYYSVLVLCIMCKDTNSKAFVDWAIKELSLYGLEPDNS